MPNIKSAAKRDQISKLQNARNRAAKSLIKTSIKKFEAAVISKNRADVLQTYGEAVKTVDRAVSRGLIHKNNAAHKKSALTIKLNDTQQ
jgi:small subunit ribosomal protein S20